MNPKAPLARCDLCPLKDRPVVRAESRDQARLVIVGEAPGDQEVIEGRPFVGRSGVRLNQALAAADLHRSDVYVTNAVLCRPAGTPPTPPDDAVSACHDRLIVEVSRLGPDKVLAMGKVAADSLTGDRKALSQLRQRPAPSPFLPREAEVRVTYHPSALNRDPRWPGWFDEDVRWLGGR
jgi:uracil-DNA glycosylase